MKYGEFVRDMARLHNSMAWRYYDFHFRNMKQRYPQWPWGQVMNDIWNRALLEPSARDLALHLEAH